MEKDKKLPKIWHPQQEIILRGWGESAACYRWMHYQAFLKYRKSNMRYTLPVIVLSTITGTANFAQEQFPPGLQPYVAPSIGGLNLIAGLIATISQFLKVSELMEAHRVAAMQFGKFSRVVRLELALPLVDRSRDGADMVELMKGEYDTLIEQSPSIPAPIIDLFEKEFPLDDADVLTKPEIIHINPIQTFSAVLENSVVSKMKGLISSDKSKEELVADLQQIQGTDVPPPKKFFKKVADTVAKRQQDETKQELEELRGKTQVSKKNQKLEEELKKRAELMEVAVEDPPATQ
jgi:hypothetical protein|tara:strand:+ start:4501 stop:5376 length:876 start_codon:yes stop_codon:yes gene_type:complete